MMKAVINDVRDVMEMEIMVVFSYYEHSEG